MAKIKLNIKNTQIAEAINLSGLKGKLAKKKEEEAEVKKSAPAKPSTPKGSKPEGEELPKEETPRIRARSKSAFAEPHSEGVFKDPNETVGPVDQEEEVSAVEVSQSEIKEEPARLKTSAELRQEIFGDQDSDITESKSTREILAPLPEIKKAEQPQAQIKIEAKVESPLLQYLLLLQLCKDSSQEKRHCHKKDSDLLVDTCAITSSLSLFNRNIHVQLLQQLLLLKKLWAKNQKLSTRSPRGLKK